MCYINPEYFSQILQWMGIIVTGENSLSASISDDRKDNNHLHQGSMTDDSKDNRHHHRSMTDDSKEASSAQEGEGAEAGSGFVPDFHHITLEDSCLSTLALTCQSTVAIKQLLDSGFPAVLAQGLFEFCNKVIFQFTENYSPPEGMTDAHKSTCRCDEGGASGSVLGAMSRTTSGTPIYSIRTIGYLKKIFIHSISDTMIFHGFLVTNFIILCIVQFQVAHFKIKVL